MSGIKEIKEKAKLSIDEMFDNQSVGKMENQLSGNTTKQPPIHTTTNPDYQLLNGKKTTHKNTTSQPTTQETNQPENQPPKKTDNQPTNFNDFSMKKQQTSKPASYKMTFNLTEEAYTAFNKVYATRLLQGKKTEKSDLICEAIHWLIQMEEQSH